MIPIGNGTDLASELVNGVGQPQLLYFTAPWCVNCKKLTPFLERLETEQRLRVLKVDTDEALDIADAYDVVSLPSFVFFKCDGTRWSQTSDGSDVELLEGPKQELLEVVIADWLVPNAPNPSPTNLSSNYFSMDEDF